jgi:PAS domain S-box-containing protein
MSDAHRGAPREAAITDERRFYRLLATTTDALWMARADGTVARESTSWRAFTGQAEAEQRGWGWLDAIRESDRERLKVALKIGLLTRSAVRCEQWVRRADGTQVYTALAATPILQEDGLVGEWIGAFIDINGDRPIAWHLDAQSRALEELASGSPLKEVLDFIARGVEVQDPEAPCSILLVQNRRLWSGAAPSLPAVYMAAIDGVAIGPGVGSCGHAAHTGETVVCADLATHPNWEAGRHVALAHGLRSCWSMPILSRAREVLGVFAQYRRHPYEPVPKDFQRVAAAIHIAGVAIERHRTDQALLARNQALLDADRRKDVFLAMLAHELRNPLAPLRFAEQLMESCADDPGAIQKLRGIIGRQTRQLTRLVDDLLDVSRITRGAITLRKERVTVQSLVQAALEGVQSRIATRRHRFEVELPAQPVWVHADPVRMIQILSNLLDNAAKYTEDDGAIYTSVGVSGDDVLTTVRDTGVGMEPEVLETAFQLFTQADTSLARSQGGLGIGLTVVRNLVEMHGGTVSASSPGLGQGSEFVVRLPLARDHSPSAVSEKRERASAGRRPRKRVLVVDDNRDAADALEMALAATGYDVCVAYDGKHALAVAHAFGPEVAFIDIGLPGMDGYEIARRLRAGSATRRPRLVALTGYGQESDQARSLEAGFDRHLVKPVDLEVVLHELTLDVAETVDASGPDTLGSAP